MPAPKRGRSAPITDFSIVEGELPQVAAVLNYRIQPYAEFIKSLAPDDFKKFGNYCIKQKNMDRNIEYVKNNMKIKIEYEALCFPRFFFKQFPKLFLWEQFLIKNHGVHSQRKSLGMNPESPGGKPPKIGGDSPVSQNSFSGFIPEEFHWE